MKRLDKELADRTAVPYVQTDGKMGYYVTYLCPECGRKMVALDEVEQKIYAPNAKGDVYLCEEHGGFEVI